MADFRRTVRDSQGNAVSGATIKVYLAGTSTLASIFSDAALTVAIDQVASPLENDSDGTYEFFAATGDYKIEVSHPSLPTQTYDNVTIGYSVPGTRSLTATSPLTGGGDLSADRTLGFDAFVDVRAYGAVGDGTTDDTAAIQAAIDAAEASGGGRVFLPALDFAITATLAVNQAVLIAGSGSGEDTNNGSGSAVAATKLKWTGTAGTGPMVKFSSTTSGNWLTGGGIENIFLDANLAATGCVWVDSCKHLVLGRAGARLRLRNAQSFGLKLSSENAVLCQFCSIYADYRVGQTGNTSHGLYFDCTTQAQTQHFVYYWAATVVDGDAMRLEGFIDSSNFYRVGGTVTGTGRSIVLVDAGTGVPQKNIFWFVNGNFEDTGTGFGNRIFYFNSEGKGITLAAGARLHYSTIDWTHGDAFETHVYPMDDQVQVAAASFGLTSGSATLGAQGVWSAWNLPDASSARIATFLGDRRWANGTITKIRVHFTKGSASTSENVVLNIDVTTKALGDVVISTPDHQSGNLTAPVLDGVRRNDYYDYTLGTPLSFTRGDIIMLSIQRVGANASDTLVQDLGFLGATVFYLSDGPDSSGAGSFPVPLPYKT